METTDKDSCRILVDLLCKHKVKHAVISPGSRNAPLIISISRCDQITSHLVIDERCAAFIALGIASYLQEPVALICTSGSALLNYAPAIAEAYYRKLPLIVISADRPAEWIDQDDSQTIRQYEALANYVKRSYNIPSECPSDTTKWYINRTINDALLLAVHARKSPVHINIQLSEPLNRIVNINPAEERYIEMISPSCEIPESKISQLATTIKDKRILILSGFHEPSQQLNHALTQLAEHENIVVMIENISNLQNNKFISSIDRTLNELTDIEKKELRPDIVITLGGALVSRHIKQYLRQIKPLEHWHIGINDVTVDCFTSLTKRIETTPEAFFKQLSTALPPSKSCYSHNWQTISNKAETSLATFLNQAPWCDFSAMNILFNSLPSSWNLHLSNGTSIRYSQLFNTTRFNRIDCNRGVSGIDGCTSTAIGSSIVSNETTLLISGDMCAQYDFGALLTAQLSSKFKMIVLNNGGGGIFRFIKSTSSLPELETYFAAKTNLPLKQIADHINAKYYDCHDEQSLKIALNNFITDDDRPSILEIFTPGDVSAEILKNYFKNN